MKIIKVFMKQIQIRKAEKRKQRLEEEKAVKISEAMAVLESNKRMLEKKVQQHVARTREEHPLLVIDKEFKMALNSLQSKKRQIQIEYENSSWWGQMNFPTHLEVDIKKKIKKISKKQSEFFSEYKKEIKRIKKKYKEADIIVKKRLNIHYENAKSIIEEQYQDVDSSRALHYGMWGSIFGLTVSATNDLYESGQVYDTLRSVNSNFSDMSDSEIWWETLFMDSDSIVGLISLTKGALFEDMVANDTGGVLYEHFNHPVTDIVIDGTEIQLKATDNASYVNGALENSTVMATSEVADRTGAIDSGISNEDLTDQVANALGGTVLDVGDIAFDTLLGGGMGLGTIPTLKGLAHINKNFNDPDRYIEGAEIAIVGTAKGVVDTSEMIYNAATSPTGKAVGKAGVSISIGVGKGLMWGLEKTLGKL